MGRNKRLLDNFKSIGFVFLYLIIFVINTKVVDQIFKVTSMDKMDGAIGTLVNVYLKLILLTAIPLLIYYLILKKRKRNILKFCKFKQMSLKKYVACIGLGISISVYILLFMKIPYVEENMPALEGFFSGFDHGSILSYILFTFIIYTITEEVLFRGLIFNELTETFPVSISVIIQALLFVFMQSDIVSIVFGICSYLIYCLVYIFTDSIWGSVAVLYTSHSFVLLTRRMGIADWLSNIDFPLLIVGVSISLVISGLILYYLFKNNKVAKNFIK